MPEKITATICTYHPSREGAGICITCRKTFCSECLTRYDGINYCRICLESRTHKKKAALFSLSFIKNILLISICFCFFYASFYFAGKILLKSRVKEQSSPNNSVSSPQQKQEN